MTWRNEKISSDFYAPSIWARVQDHPKIYGLICQKIGDHLEKPTLEEIENASGGRVRFIYYAETVKSEFKLSLFSYSTS